MLHQIFCVENLVESLFMRDFTMPPVGVYWFIASVLPFLCSIIVFFP